MMTTVTNLATMRDGHTVLILDASDLEDYSDEDEDEDARDDVSVAPSRRSRGHRG